MDSGHAHLIYNIYNHSYMYVHIIPISIIFGFFFPRVARSFPGVGTRNTLYKNINISITNN